LVKPFEIQELLVRARALLRRNMGVKVDTGEILTAGDLQIFPDSLEVSKKGHPVKLTPIEFEILYCLMQHVNNPVTLTRLLNEVWGYEADEDVRMLRVHIGGLRQKLEFDPKSPKYVQTVTNVGYKLVPVAD
jgi:two-component system, OmpR family, response regulator RpaA